MTTITRQRACDAFTQAANEFEANPKLRAVGALAENKRGVAVSTLDPTACCFCALGLVAKKLGINTTSTNEVRDVLTLDADIRLFDTRRVFVTNDEEERGEVAKTTARMRRLVEDYCPSTENI